MSNNFSNKFLIKFIWKCFYRNGTIFTESLDNGYKMRSDRPAILVSSSSWTEDEDFHLLIEAFDGKIHCN